jgi:methionyl-tRNA formyltransferase
MMKVLVISDNKTLVQHLRETINLQSISELADFEYRFSEANKKPFELASLGMKPINLKKDAIVRDIVNTFQLVLSLHCKQIFPPSLTNNLTCINFHPGLNPYNRGWYPQVFSIINKMPIGATIHLMNEQVDHGPIIAQEEIKIYSHETSLDVYQRVIELEKLLITKYIKKIVQLQYSANPVSFDGNYNSISDFANLCSLNLDSFGTLGQHIDLLRALTHGNFRNAFYLDGDKKVIVQIRLMPEPDDQEWE